MNYRTLPRGYVYAGSMDFMRNRKQLIAVTLLSLALLVVPAALALPFRPIGPGWALMKSRWYLWPGLAAALIAYIPLHELTHGIAMLALSGVKPRYGLKLPYAWCGSTAWFDRKSHIVTALAPVVVWGIGIQVAIARLPADWFWPLWALQLSNLSGSAGDIYCAWALARMDGELLIQDTGVRMRIVKRTHIEDKNA